MSNESREEGEANRGWHSRLTQVVDDEAAVGAASGGLAELGLDVGQPGGGEDVPDAVGYEVAGVRQ